MQISSPNTDVIYADVIANSTNRSQNTRFSSYLENTDEQKLFTQEAISYTTHEESKSTKELIDDLVSSVTPDLPLSEMWPLQESLTKIKKLIREESENTMSADREKEINNLISQLEESVSKLQIEVTGESTISPKNETSEKFENRIAVLKTVVSEVSHEKFGQMSIGEIGDLPYSYMETIPEDVIEAGRLEVKESFTDEKFENLLAIANLENLSDIEKELYRSIIEDNFISNEEVENLSYKQIETLSEFLWVRDENNSIIRETAMNMDTKTGALLSSTVLSDDENFNEAIFTMIQKMDDEREILNFLYPITGTYASASLLAFPEIDHINYDGANMDEVLTDLIDEYQIILENTLKANVVEFAQNKIAQFTELYNIYQELSGNKDEKIATEEYISDISQYLLDDFISLMKTGLTVSEVEKLDKALAMIDKLIEDSEEKEISEEAIKDMIKEIKRELDELYQRLGGKGEIEMNEDLETQNSEGLTQTMKEFKSIVASLKIALEEIKSTHIKDDRITTDDELQLIQELKQ